MVHDCEVLSFCFEIAFYLIVCIFLHFFTIDHVSDRNEFRCTILLFTSYVLIRYKDQSPYMRLLPICCILYEIIRFQLGEKVGSDPFDRGVRGVLLFLEIWIVLAFILKYFKGVSPAESST